MKMNAPEGKFKATINNCALPEKLSVSARLVNLAFLVGFGASIAILLLTIFWLETGMIDYVQAIVIAGFCLGFIIFFQYALNRRERKKSAEAQKKITYHEQLLLAVNRSAEMLITEAMDDPHNALNDIMELLCKNLKIDRMSIWKNVERDGELWYSRDIGWERESAKDTLLPYAEYPYARSLPLWQDTMAQGKTRSGIVSELTEEERNILMPIGYKSVLVVPVMIQNEFWGFVSYGDCTDIREFEQMEIDILKSSSYLMVNAVVRNNMTNDLIEATDEALRGTKAKSDFLANMSHEIRTPLNAVVGMASIGKSAHDTDRKDYCFGKIQDASSHLLGVINDILDMSKIEANKLELSPIDFNFEKMLKHVVNVSTYRIDEKRQHFMVYIDENIPPILTGDDQRIAQVITNLLSNAVKFTQEEGSISLNVQQLSKSDDICTIKVEVKDNGIGISAEQQSRLFASFQQADSSTSRKFGGTGLGLAICKRIVELMDGEISVESDPGKGSVFSFSITLKYPKSVLPRRQLTNVEFKNLRVLFVDDDDNIREYFTDLADHLGFYCDTAHDAKQAQELIEKNTPYDIYFVDWKMPGIDGLELSEWIRSKDGNRTIIIMMSAFDISDVMEKAKAAGVDDFLAKPLFPSDIVDTINVKIGAAPAPESDENQVVEDDFSGSRILLVEDVEINREIVDTLLEPMSLTIDSAEDGAIAVDMFKKDPNLYDLILMDIQMPVMDGYAATKAIRDSGLPRAKDIPIIAMTASVFREDIDRCIAAGMDMHIGKPLDFEDLLEVLHRYLKGA
jgi:signal transduction histidine kinase/DNA-binding response OmpR family regulator